MSTSLALLELTEEITSAFDKKKYYWCFYRLKKAFDTIDHTFLLAKLRHYGVRGVANYWLSSYSENRLQYVSFRDTDSILRNVILVYLRVQYWARHCLYRTLTTFAMFDL